MHDRRLGPYELLDVVGRGGFAVVWLARRVDGQAPRGLVALKTVHPEATVDAKLENMLVTEACVASRVDHPNVARVYELGDADGVLYLVMEYVDGESLSGIARALRDEGRTIPLDVIIAVVADVCCGLHAAHELRDGGELVGVVHRDVSPQNILVSRTGQVKLVDFGIAKARAYSMSETTAGIAKGKRHYMAPEQVTAQPLDRRVDVWAVAAVAYELIEGRPVHDGPNEMARLHALVHSETARPFDTDVPSPIANVLYRALSRDPDQRQATAEQLRDELLAAASQAGLAPEHVNLAELVASTEHRPLPPARTQVLRDAEVPRARKRARSGNTVLFTAPLLKYEPTPPAPFPPAGPDPALPPASESGAASPPVETNARARANGRSWPLLATAMVCVATVALAAPFVRRSPAASSPVLAASVVSNVSTAPPATIAAAPPSPIVEPSPNPEAIASTAHVASAPSAAPPRAVGSSVQAPKKRPTGKSPRRSSTARSDLLDDTID